MTKDIQTKVGNVSKLTIVTIFFTSCAFSSALGGCAYTNALAKANYDRAARKACRTTIGDNSIHSRSNSSQCRDGIKADRGKKTNDSKYHLRNNS